LAGDAAADVDPADAADFDPVDAIELLAGVAAAAAPPGAAAAGGAGAFGDADGGDGGLTVYRAKAADPFKTARFWTNSPQTEYSAGVEPDGG
jgi:hypothetical protein